MAQRRVGDTLDANTDAAELGRVGRTIVYAMSVVSVIANTQLASSVTETTIGIEYTYSRPEPVRAKASGKDAKTVVSVPTSVGNMICSTRESPPIACPDPRRGACVCCP